MLSALMLLTVSAGCAGAQSADRSTTPPPERTSSPGRLSGAAIDLATHSGTWPTTERTLMSAEVRLVRACMEEKGFRYPAPDPPARPAPEDEKAAVELTDRSRTGYGISQPPSQAPGPGPAPVDRYYRTLPAARQRAFDQALDGPPDKKVTVSGTDWGEVRVATEGCDAESRSRLAGSPALWARITYVPERYDNELGRRVPSAPAYVRAMAEWRSCMADRGLPYRSPEQAQDALRKERRTADSAEAFRHREIAVAVADGACALRAHLPAVSLRVQRELVSTLSRDEQHTLTELAAYREAALRRARTVL
ncbi:hypothetical protein [Streptomyces melanogenes]|uniref:hypothetical protein n=1 Tax=Streptomyces melanogenes TaxID=67326 RepID=UPI00167ECD29|nr:hypothetical protein [Streptomyces melanogenes]